MRFRLFAALILCLSAAGAKAQGTSDYFAIVLGTAHFTGDDLNDINPGLTLGRRWQVEERNLEYHLEGGCI